MGAMGPPLLTNHPSIISYMTKQALPAVSTLTTTSHEDFKTADKVVLVAYYAADDKASNATFSEVAESLRDDYLFGATNDDALAKAAGVKQPAIVLYKAFDEGKNTFAEKFDKEAITKFTKTAATPLVGEVGPDTYAGYMAVRYDLSTIRSGLLTIDSLVWSATRLHLRRDARGAGNAGQGAQSHCRGTQGCGQLCHH